MRGWGLGPGAASGVRTLLIAQCCLRVASFLRLLRAQGMGRWVEQQVEQHVQLGRDRLVGVAKHCWHSAATPQALTAGCARGYARAAPAACPSEPSQAPTVLLCAPGPCPSVRSTDPCQLRAPPDHRGPLDHSRVGESVCIPRYAVWDVGAVCTKGRVMSRCAVAVALRLCNSTISTAVSVRSCEAVTRAAPVSLAHNHQPLPAQLDPPMRSPSSLPASV